MENQEKSSEKLITHPIVIPNSIITIEVSEFYLRRCQKLLFALAGQMGKDPFVESMTKLKENKPAETFEEGVLEVVLPLVDAIEKAAQTQGKIEVRTFSPLELLKAFDSI